MKIYSPNKDYTGISASVPFCGGVGETNDPYLIKWFKDHGYTVEEMKPDEKVQEVEDAEEVKKATKGKKGGE